MRLSDLKGSDVDISDWLDMSDCKKLKMNTFGQMATFSDYEQYDKAKDRKGFGPHTVYVICAKVKFAEKLDCDGRTKLSQMPKKITRKQNSNPA